MPRRPRDVSPGYHHVWVNATGGSPYFVDSVDRMAWIRSLVRVLSQMSWRCLAFCQMSTHVHLVLSTPEPSLPVGMRDLNREYSHEFNNRHDRVGTLLRKRYGSRRIEGGVDLIGAYAYVVLNPVAEGLCNRPEDWPWSSYRTTIGLAKDFPFVDATDVIGEAGGSREALQRAVEAIVGTGPDRTRREPGSGRVRSS
jgi:putative transposase